MLPHLILAQNKKYGFDARAVANFLLCQSREIGLPLTNLQIQKVIFFAHARFLECFGKPLITNRFEAWDHGPVVPELYRTLKRFGMRPITGLAQIQDLESGRFIDVIQELPDTVEAHLNEMLTFYGRMDPWELVKLSHKPGSAWDRTVRMARNRANISLVISTDDILNCSNSERAKKYH